MAQRPDLGKQERWLELIRRWQRSQTTIREFCERNQQVCGKTAALMSRRLAMVILEDAAQAFAAIGFAFGQRISMLSVIDL